MRDLVRRLPVGRRPCRRPLRRGTGPVRDHPDALAVAGISRVGPQEIVVVEDYGVAVGVSLLAKPHAAGIGCTQVARAAEFRRAVDLGLVGPDRRARATLDLDPIPDARSENRRPSGQQGVGGVVGGQVARRIEPNDQLAPSGRSADADDRLVVGRRLRRVLKVESDVARDDAGIRAARCAVCVEAVELVKASAGRGRIGLQGVAAVAGHRCLHRNGARIDSGLADIPCFPTAEVHRRQFTLPGTPPMCKKLLPAAPSLTLHRPSLLSLLSRPPGLGG